MIVSYCQRHAHCSITAAEQHASTEHGCCSQVENYLTAADNRHFAASELLWNDCRTGRANTGHLVRSTAIPFICTKQSPPAAILIGAAMQRSYGAVRSSDLLRRGDKADSPSSAGTPTSIPNTFGCVSAIAASHLRLLPQPDFVSFPWLSGVNQA